MQFLNIEVSIIVKPPFNVFGIFILVNPVQSANAAAFISSTLPNSTAVNPVHFQNEFFAILFILLGITTFVIFVAPVNASSPNATTFKPSNVEGIVTFPVNSVGFVHFKSIIWFDLSILYSHFTVTPFITLVVVWTSAANTTLVILRINIAIIKIIKYLFDI